MKQQQSTASRPWRSLAVLLVLAIALVAGMWATGGWQPRLGLDLQGGTSITLTAQTPDGGTPSQDAMDQALEIISDRVNGAGVAEPDIVRSGSDNIVVAIPNVNEDEIVRLVGQTAVLNFRPVLTAVAGGSPAPQPTATPSASPTGSASPSATPSRAPTARPPSATASPATANRAFAGLPGQDTTASPSPSPTGSVAPTPTPNATQPGTPAQPTQEQLEQLAALDCSTLQFDGPDDPTKPLLTCDQDGAQRFLLGPADVEGDRLTDAYAGIPQGQISWVVNLEFDGEGTRQFRESTTRLSQQPAFPQNAFAIVLDGRVVSAPTVNEPIPNGQAIITGDFTQAEATELANVLKYGSLPLEFTTSEVTTVSPQLGADQLEKGLIAGAIGLLLVVLAAFLFYRALGFIVVLSLLVAGGLIYGLISLLGETQGLALVLAGVVGLIVSIGITADSFVILFERVRDEIREGRSIRMAVETGWRRARHTIIVSDAVSMAAAVFLYVFAAGSVKGFAFTLGLATLVDAVVVFLFSKPLLTLLARTKFFGRGHPLSGFDPRRIGAPQPVLTGPAPRRLARKEA